MAKVETRNLVFSSHQCHREGQDGHKERAGRSHQQLRAVEVQSMNLHPPPMQQMRPSPLHVNIIITSPVLRFEILP